MMDRCGIIVVSGVKMWSPDEEMAVSHGTSQLNAVGKAMVYAVVWSLLFSNFKCVQNMYP